MSAHRHKCLRRPFEEAPVSRSGLTVIVMPQWDGRRDGSKTIGWTT